ncbi:hypothetical protein DYH09_12415 [bacterium CPR1]|nr:hypothetical protein [bacterium CPR1]
MLPICASFQGTARYLLGGDYPRLEPAESHPGPARAALATGPDGSTVALEPDGTLTARHSDGTLRWTRKLEGELHPPLVDAEGNAYLAAREGRVVSLDPEGNPRWEREVRGRLSDPPILAGNHTLGLISRHEIGLIVNLDSRSGVSRFERPLMGQVIIRGPLGGGPEGNLYFFNGNDHVLHCYEPDGKSPWRYPVGDYLGKLATSPEGTVFVPRMFGDVLALDPKSGKKLWSHRPGSVTPQINPEGVVRSGETVLRLDADGQPVWSRRLPEKLETPPVSDASGATFLASESTVYALTTEAGQPQASFRPGSGLAPPLALEEGALVADESGNLHRLTLTPSCLAETPSARVVSEGERVLVGGVALPRRKA